MEAGKDRTDAGRVVYTVGVRRSCCQIDMSYGHDGGIPNPPSSVSSPWSPQDLFAIHQGITRPAARGPWLDGHYVGSTSTMKRGCNTVGPWAGGLLRKAKYDTARRQNHRANVLQIAPSVRPYLPVVPFSQYFFFVFLERQTVSASSQQPAASFLSLLQQTRFGGDRDREAVRRCPLSS